MPQTHLALHYHLVFHTKNNEPIIAIAWRAMLHAYLGGCLKRINAVAIAIGGTADHVHLLIGLRATHCLADLVKDIKVASSKWVHQELQVAAFAWQSGYGAFTVGTPQLEKVRAYVLNQEQHHRVKSVKDEYVEMLKMADVDYDERYLW